MQTYFKLLITIDIAKNLRSDPTQDFFKQLHAIKADSIEKFSVDLLPASTKEQDVREAIIEHGVTSSVLPKGYLEAAGTPYDRESDIILTFKKFLDRIILSDHLILIDPYLFYSDDDGGKYSNFVLRIFQGHLKKLNKVTFITKKSNSKKQAREVIIDKFLGVKSHLKIDVKYTNLFHDRMWICEDKGMFVGTSLNGIGQSYCLIDYINRQDINAIRGYLKKEKLL